jgi:hypothetical protein
MTFIAVLVFLVVYLPLFGQSPGGNPLLENLTQALQLSRGSGTPAQTRSALWSLTYLDYVWRSLQAMMYPQTQLVYETLQKVCFGLWGTLLLWVFFRVFRPVRLRDGSRPPFDVHVLFGLFGLSFLLSFLFETFIMERWDITFLSFLLLLLFLLRYDRNWLFRGLMVVFVPLQIFLGAHNLVSQKVSSDDQKFLRQHQEIRKILKKIQQRHKVEMVLVPLRYKSYDLYIRAQMRRALRGVYFVDVSDKGELSFFKNDEYGGFYDAWTPLRRIRKHRIKHKLLRQRLKGQVLFVFPELRLHWRRWKKKTPLNRQLAPNRSPSTKPASTTPTTRPASPPTTGQD